MEPIWAAHYNQKTSADSNSTQNSTLGHLNSSRSCWSLFTRSIFDFDVEICQFGLIEDPRTWQNNHWTETNQMSYCKIMFTMVVGIKTRARGWGVVLESAKKSILLDSTSLCLFLVKIPWLWSHNKPEIHSFPRSRLASFLQSYRSEVSLLFLDVATRYLVSPCSGLIYSGWLLAHHNIFNMFPL